jgi:hypothetical protein
VAQLVASQAREVRPLACARHDLVHTGRGQRPTATRTFQHNEDPVRRRGVRTFNPQVVSHRAEEPVGDRYDPLVTTLALGDEQATLARPQIPKPQAEDLAATEPTEQHRLHHRSITIGPKSA